MNSTKKLPIIHLLNTLAHIPWNNIRSIKNTSHIIHIQANFKHGWGLLTGGVLRILPNCVIKNSLFAKNMLGQPDSLQIRHTPPRLTSHQNHPSAASASNKTTLLPLCFQCRRGAAWAASPAAARPWSASTRTPCLRRRSGGRSCCSPSSWAWRSPPTARRWRCWGTYCRRRSCTSAWTTGGRGG